MYGSFLVLYWFWYGLTHKYDCIIYNIVKYSLICSFSYAQSRNKNSPTLRVLLTLFAHVSLSPQEEFPSGYLHVFPKSP